MFIFVLPNYHILLPKTKTKNKICRASMVFLLQKKNPSTKIPNNPFKLESITASYCGYKLMRRKKTRDGVEIFFDF
jgi:hypothetical protein